MGLSVENLYKVDSDLRTSNCDVILADVATVILKTQQDKTSSINLNNIIILTEFYKFLSKTIIRNTAIDVSLVNEILFRLLKQLSAALNVDWQDCVKIFASNNVDIEDVTLSKHVEVITLIINQLEINNEYDIPYLAGYSFNNPKKIYLDRDLYSNIEVTEFIIYALAIHEFIEKILMIELRGISYLYFRTHQIAQRIEKDVIESFGCNWDWYQNVLMAKEIERAYINIPKKIPFDLDYVPYMDCEDHDLINRMKLKAQ